MASCGGGPTKLGGSRRILITGATGYIGRRLVAQATAAGHAVVATTRRPGRVRFPEGVEGRIFDLAAPREFTRSFPDVDAVIHLAAVIAEDSQPAGQAEDTNVSGTRHLIEAVRAHGVQRFVFVSSQSAARDARSRYGRSKWAIEQLLSDEGEIVVHPGMVSGGSPRGLFGLLYRLCRRTRWLPLIRFSAPVYPVHVDDLCHALLRLTDPTGHPPRRVQRVAPATPVRFADYVRSIARERVGLPVRLLPVPQGLALLASRITEAVPWLPTVPRERILGLISLKPYPADPEGGPETLRDVGDRLALEGRRRVLICEGRTLMHYVLGGVPPSGAVRRYVRAVLQDASPVPLVLPWWVCARPAFLRLIEPVAPDALWKRRLSLATRIIEMTPVGATRFHSYEPRSRCLTVMSMAGVGLAEALLWPLRFVVARRLSAAREPSVREGSE